MNRQEELLMLEILLQISLMWAKHIFFFNNNSWHLLLSLHILVIRLTLQMASLSPLTLEQLSKEGTIYYPRLNNEVAEAQRCAVIYPRPRS